MSDFKFTVHTSSTYCKARTGTVTTSHGEIQTPIFMPVGTQGSVKAIEQQWLKDIGSQIILGNTYHLSIRPGIELLREFGGLHKFMKWDKPILTDSGGFQVFSLKDLRKITEVGVQFRSHVDGAKLFFTSEEVINIQRHIGSDIMMVFDECTPYPCDYDYAKKSMERSIRWELRCLEAHKTQPLLYEHSQALFAIGQGSVYPELRKMCLEELCNHDFDGIAIGGLAVGEPAENMYEIVDKSTDVIPKEKPRYLMGVGTPQNILRNIALGIDMFDCVMPTRNARNGTLFTTTGRVNIRNNQNKNSHEPIDAGLDNALSQTYSRAYLRHLFMANEIVGLQLATIQNLNFYLWLVKTAREKINEGTFTTWANSFINEFYPETRVSA
ncbi:MAG: tRNA guanosine(34) transglycosylase Tgt [Candidatus Kapaibacterium sp.]|nr:tRNA guanosine(34) transglycosylase Tgt [Bacteroidota bacterium]